MKVFPIWFVLAGVFLAVQPLCHPFELVVYDWHRWVEALMLAGAVFVCLPVTYRVYCLLSLPAGRGVILLGLVTLLSTVLSSVGLVSWVALLRLWLWGVLLISLPVAFSCATVESRRKVAWGVMIVLGLYACYIGVGVFVLAINGVYDRTIAVSNFANVNHAAGFLALSLVALPAFISNISSERSFLRLSAVLLVAAPLVMLLLVIGSRGSFLGMTMGVLAVIVLARRETAVSYCKTLSYGFFSGAALYGLLRWTVGVGGSLDSPQKSLFSDSGRLHLYQLAWEGIVKAPLWGHGPLSYAAIDETLLAHPHNLFLTFLYEYGSVATLLGALLLAALLVWVFKNRARWVGSLDAVAGMAVVVAFAVHSQVSGLAMVPLSLCILALGIGLWGAPIIADVYIDQDFRWRSIGLSVVVGGVYLVLVSLYWAGLSDNMMPTPRFWLQGELPLGS